MLSYQEHVIHGVFQVWQAFGVILDEDSTQNSYAYTEISCHKVCTSSVVNGLLAEVCGQGCPPDVPSDQEHVIHVVEQVWQALGAILDDYFHT